MVHRSFSQREIHSGQRSDLPSAPVVQTDLRSRRRQHPSRLNKNLGFSPEDRKENIRRIAEVGRPVRRRRSDHHYGFHLPLREDRDAARALIGRKGSSRFSLKRAWIPASCEIQRFVRKSQARRDQGIYRNIAPYEEPLNPSIILDADQLTVEEEDEQVIRYLTEKKFIQTADFLFFLLIFRIKWRAGTSYLPFKSPKKFTRPDLLTGLMKTKIKIIIDCSISVFFSACGIPRGEHEQLKQTASRKGKPAGTEPNVSG